MSCSKRGNAGKGRAACLIAFIKVSGKPLGMYPDHMEEIIKDLVGRVFEYTCNFY